MPDKEHFQCVIDIIDPQPIDGDIYSMSTGEFIGIGQNKTPTLLSRDWKDPIVIAYKKGEIIERE